MYINDISSDLTALAKSTLRSNVTSTQKGDVTQQYISEKPVVTLTQHASKYQVLQHHHRHTRGPW